MDFSLLQLCAGALVLMSHIIGSREIVSEITTSVVNLKCTRVGSDTVWFSIDINSGITLLSFMLLGTSGARLHNSGTVLLFG